jgi:hypothetical protein
MVTARPGRASGGGACVYDMYPWNQPDRRDDAPRPRRAARHAARHMALATRAVQVALDRRDNGGDSTASPGQ